MAVDDDLRQLIELIKKLLDELQKKPACFSNIKLPMEGSADGDNPVTAAANAALDAQKKLTTFGDTWCQAGKEKCPQAQCKPTLSDISVTATKTSPVRDPHDAEKITGYHATVSLTGTISCECKAA